MGGHVHLRHYQSLILTTLDVNVFGSRSGLAEDQNLHVSPLVGHAGGHGGGEVVGGRDLVDELVVHVEVVVVVPRQAVAGVRIGIDQRPLRSGGLDVSEIGIGILVVVN